MSQPKRPEPARLIVGILASRGYGPDSVQGALTEAFGTVEEVIGPLAFDFTNYYSREMGEGIQRWILVFSRLVERAELAKIKCLTNRIEQSYTVGGARRVNLDPGFMTLGNFILATGKNNAHRVYLDHGIFADLTLIFREGSYRPLEWTYPDYAEQELIGFLNRLRKSYKCCLDRQALLTG